MFADSHCTATLRAIPRRGHQRDFPKGNGLRPTMRHNGHPRIHAATKRGLRGIPNRHPQPNVSFTPLSGSLFSGYACSLSRQPTRGRRGDPHFHGPGVTKAQHWLASASSSRQLARCIVKRHVLVKLDHEGSCKLWSKRHWQASGTLDNGSLELPPPPRLRPVCRVPDRLCRPPVFAAAPPPCPVRARGRGRGFDNLL